MLQKKYRLPAHVKLSKLSSFTTTFFFLKTSKNDLDYNRFGFVVSKTIDKRATVRNRTRRVFRSCIEEMINEIKPGIDMLFVLKRGALEIERKEMYNELHGFFVVKHLLK